MSHLPLATTTKLKQSEMLINKVKTLLAGKGMPEQRLEGRNLELACAALMFEVARADFAIEAAEQQTLSDSLSREFRLSAEELATVTEEAAERVDAATCLFEFTRAVNELATVDQKRALLGMMWRVAMADNVLSRYEEHVIRKVADLLHLPHSDFILAKRDAS